MKDFSPHAILRSDLTSDEEVEWLIEAALIRRGGEGPVILIIDPPFSPTRKGERSLPERSRVSERLPPRESKEE